MSFSTSRSAIGPTYLLRVRFPSSNISRRCLSQPSPGLVVPPSRPHGRPDPHTYTYQPGHVSTPLWTAISGAMDCHQWSCCEVRLLDDAAPWTRWDLKARETGRHNTRTSWGSLG